MKKARYLAVRGTGAPGSEAYVAAIGALYGVAYTIKMTRKFADRGDYVIGKLEGQYWADEEVEDLKAVPMDRWHWRLMIRTPDIVTRKDLADAVAVLLEKNKGAEVREVALTSISEGSCVPSRRARR